MPRVHCASCCTQYIAADTYESEDDAQHSQDVFDDMFIIAASCWAAKPQDRPTFPDLRDTIGEMLQNEVLFHGEVGYWSLCSDFGVVRWGGSRRSGSNSKQGKSARTQADTHTHRHTQTQRQTHTDTETDTQTHGHTDRHRHTQTQTHTFARYVRPRETWCTSVSCS